MHSARRAMARTAAAERKIAAAERKIAGAKIEAAVRRGVEIQIAAAVTSKKNGAAATLRPSGRKSSSSRDSVRNSASSGRNSASLNRFGVRSNGSSKSRGSNNNRFGARSSRSNARTLAAWSVARNMKTKIMATAVGARNSSATSRASAVSGVITARFTVATGRSRPDRFAAARFTSEMPSAKP